MLLKVVPQWAKSLVAGATNSNFTKGFMLGMSSLLKVVINQETWLEWHHLVELIPSGLLVNSLIWKPWPRPIVFDDDDHLPDLPMGFPGRYVTHSQGVNSVKQLRDSVHRGYLCRSPTAHRRQMWWSTVAEGIVHGCSWAVQVMLRSEQQRPNKK